MALVLYSNNVTIIVAILIHCANYFFAGQVDVTNIQPLLGMFYFDGGKSNVKDDMSRHELTQVLMQEGP